MKNRLDNLDVVHHDLIDRQVGVFGGVVGIRGVEWHGLAEVAVLPEDHEALELLGEVLGDETRLGPEVLELALIP